jgi:hypothetical protein
MLSDIVGFVKNILVFLRLLFFEEFSKAFLITKIVISSFYSFPNGSSPWDIGLAIGILNELFRPGLLT